MYGFDDYETAWYNFQYDLLCDKFYDADKRKADFAVRFYDLLLSEMENDPVGWLNSHPLPEVFDVH